MDGQLILDKMQVLADLFSFGDKSTLGEKKNTQETKKATNLVTQIEDIDRSFEQLFDERFDYIRVCIKYICFNREATQREYECLAKECEEIKKLLDRYFG